MFCCWMLRDATSIGEGASAGWSLWIKEACALSWVVKFALFDTRLLNAGQPLHASAPPVPLHRPPPGHEPTGV